MLYALSSAVLFGLVSVLFVIGKRSLTPGWVAHKAAEWGRPGTHVVLPKWRQQSVVLRAKIKRAQPSTWTSSPAA